MSMQSPRDKYGFKTLSVGETKTVPDVRPKHAQMMAATYCRRYPEMVHKDFTWKPLPGGGVEIRRVR